MKRRFLTFFGVLAISVALALGGQAQEAWAAPSSGSGEQESCGGSFLGFVPWYEGLTDGDCNIQTPTGDATGEGLATFVWKIVSNILIDLFTAVGYLAVGFIIYGGYLYMMSNGDPGRAAKAQKALTAAVIGLIIAVMANIIVRTLTFILID